MTDNFTIRTTIGGIAVPVTKFSIVGGAYGSVGHADMMTSRRALAISGLNLIGAAENAPAGLEVGIWVTDQLGVMTQIFGGEYVTGKWDFDKDTVAVTCRDWAGVLVDQKRILSSLVGDVVGVLAPGQSADSSGVSTQNQSLSALVTQIAKQFSLTPELHLPEDGGVDVGSIFGEAGGANDTVYTTVPQSLWALLNRLARDTGNTVYVTPDKRLVFGEPGAGAPTLQMTYKVNPVPAGSVPCKGLQITHNPRRNSSFRVQVLSYDPQSAQISEGDAYAIGTGLSGNNTISVAPGIWSGQDAEDITGQFTAENKQFPLYTFHKDGLTQAQAQAQATAIAQDIASRELVLDARIDCYPSIIPSNKTRISGDLDDEFAGHDYWAQSFTHTFGMPTARGADTGLETKIMALDLRIQGSGKALVKKPALK